MLTILKYPDLRLKQVSHPVTAFDAELAKLLDDMATTMYAANGVGLAAPQVGRFVRAFIIDVRGQDERYNRILEFINPELSNGRGSIDYQEACLSVPGVSESVRRKSNIFVRYQDREGNRHEMDAEGILAVALQHENDHLDGVLFVDRLSPLKRRMLRKRLDKSLVL